MKNKLILTTAWIGVASAIFLIILVTFWLIYPYKPAHINSIRVPDSVESGKNMTYTIDYCKHIDKPATVVRSFVNGVVFTLNSMETNNPLGCHVNKSVILVPQELNSGIYQLRTTWTYKVNPLTEVSVTAISNSFEIVGSDTDRQTEQGN